MNLAYIATALKNHSCDVEIYNQDIHHYPEEHLTQYLDQNQYDVVGLGIVGGYYPYRKCLKISEAINASKNRPIYILGGHGPSPAPEYFIEKTQADVIVRGEGDITITELIDALAKHRTLDSVDGITYRSGSEIISTPDRANIPDINQLPTPDFSLFPIDIYRLLRQPQAAASDFIMPMISARGCSFKCTFCYQMSGGYRPRSAESIIEEIHILKNTYGITYIVFDDDLLMSSEKRATEISEAFISANLNIKWGCSGRINYASPNLLKLMRKAGCVFINYGIESMDDLVLKHMRKALRSEWVIPAIEATLEAGISPGLNMLYGNIGDTPETLEKSVDFLLKYSDGSQLRTIRPVTPYPGSPLYDHAIEHGLLTGIEDFYEVKHQNSDLLTVNFTNQSDQEIHRQLYKANERLIKNYIEQREVELIETTRKLYIDGDIDFRGYRQT